MEAVSTFIPTADTLLTSTPGHFERRVAYGYDADLGQVRAEFDGEHLLVRVPRRLPPVYVTNPKTRLR